MSICVQDLDYLQTVTEENLQLSGGKILSIGLRFKNLGLVFSFPFKSTSSSNLDNFEQTEIDTTSDLTIKRLNNPTTGESGYQVVSEDGTSSSTILFGSNSKKSFSIAIG